MVGVYKKLTSKTPKRDTKRPTHKMVITGLKNTHSSQECISINVSAKLVVLLLESNLPLYRNQISGYDNTTKLPLMIYFKKAEKFSAFLFIRLYQQT